MGLISKNRVPHIIVMGYLNLVKQNDVFQFCRVAHYSALSYQGIPSDKSTVPDFRIFSNDSRSVDTCRRRHFGRSGNPNIFSCLFILVLWQSVSQIHDKLPDLRQDLPRVGNPFKDCACNRLIEIKKLRYCQFFHTAPPFPYDFLDV